MQSKENMEKKKQEWIKTVGQLESARKKKTFLF